MLRRIVGITGISLWAVLIVVAVICGFQTKANGEQIFENLPEGWKVESSFTAPRNEKASISQKLGGRIRKLTNTILSIKNQRLQVNVIHCPTAKQAEKIYKAVLEAHNGLTAHVVRKGNLVVEFAKCDDMNLMNQARQALGLEDARADSVNDQSTDEQVFRNLPQGWKVEKSFVVPKNQTTAFSQKLNVRISKLSNTYLSVNGQTLQINIVHCRTSTDAEKAYKTLLEAHNGVTESVLRGGNLVVEFARCNDINLVKQAGRILNLSLLRLDAVAGKMIKNIPDGWQLENSFIISQDQTSTIGKKLGGRINNLSNTIFLVNGRKFQVNVIDCVTADDAEKIHKRILEMKIDPAFCIILDNAVVEFISDNTSLAKKAVYELGLKQKVTSKNNQVETLAKDFVNLLVKEDYAKAVENFDTTMKNALPAEQLQQAWNSVITESGPFTKQLGVRKEKVLQYEVVFVTCKFEDAVLDVKVVFSRKKQIAGLFFVPSR